MADPLAAARPERDVLLATKLHVPALQAGLVLRPRLAGRLYEGLAQGLVLVCAPAGYGKTVLLAEWVRSGQRPAAWLSLDAADNDPARFWPQGDLSGAAHWAEECGLSADDGPAYSREAGHLLLARVLLAQDRPDVALHAA